LQKLLSSYANKGSRFKCKSLEMRIADVVTTDRRGTSTGAQGLRHPIGQTITLSSGLR